MSPMTSFFAVACGILALSIINLSVGPIISKTIGTGWGLVNCQMIEDEYDEEKYNINNITKTIMEYGIDRCNNWKSMYNMEYTSFIFNLIIGFACSLIGLYGFQKEALPKTGIIGMVCGVLGFILTLIYVIFNGIVYTNYFGDGENDDAILKRDGEGAFAELDETGTQYECYYFKENGDLLDLVAKYSDLIKSQYNYNYKLDKSFKEEYHKANCKYPGAISECIDQKYIRTIYNYTSNPTITCQKLYFNEEEFDDYRNYDISARFLAVLLLSIGILLCYCFLIFSAFKQFKESSEISNDTSLLAKPPS